MTTTCTCIHEPEVDAGRTLHASYCPMTEPITTVEAAVAELGALPMPAGNPTQALSDERLAEIQARVAELGKHGLPGGTWKASPTDGKSVLPPETAHVVEDVLRTSGALLRSSVGVFGEAVHAEFAAHASEDVPALLAEIRRLKDELERPPATEYAIRFSDSSVLREGNPLDRGEQERRLADYLPECPQARLVQRTVSPWTEADR
jgi:hypothetical protein